METPAPAAGNASGLSTVLNTIAAPSEAFETLRVAPTWGWAIAITIALMLIGTYLQAPAAGHARIAQIQQFVTSSPLAANLSAARKQAMIASAEHPSAGSQFANLVLGPLFALFIPVFFNTLIMLIGNAVGRGQADFKRLWAGSVNIAVPTIGLGSIVVGIIVVLRGPDSFNSVVDIVRAVPSLSWLVPHTSLVIGGFLSYIGIFSLWGFFLNATMLRVMAKTSSGVAYAFAAIVLILGASLAAGGVAALHMVGMA